MRVLPIVLSLLLFSAGATLAESNHYFQGNPHNIYIPSLSDQDAQPDFFERLARDSERLDNTRMWIETQEDAGDFTPLGGRGYDVGDSYGHVPLFFIPVPGGLD